MKITIKSNRFLNGEQSIYLNGKINFLFGYNGSGKTTTLLELLKGSNIYVENNRLEVKNSEIYNEHFDNIPMTKNNLFKIYYFKSDDFENILMSVLNPDKSSFVYSKFKNLLFENFNKNKKEIDSKIIEIKSFLNKLIKKYIPKISINVYPKKIEIDGVFKLSGIYYKLNSGVNLSEISSGERRMLSLSMYMIQIPANGSLVLLDEPFLHYHPSLISDLVFLIQELSSMLNLTFVIATHVVTAIKYHEIENTITLIKHKNKIKVINSHNNNDIEDEGEIRTIPKNIRYILFDSIMKSFFKKNVIIVEGISDKFYIDSISKGEWQIIEAGGKDRIINSLIEVMWHAKRIKILLDGDVDNDIILKIKELLDFVNKHKKIEYDIKTTDYFLDGKKNTDIEMIFLNKDGHNMSYKEKIYEAFNFKKSEKVLKNTKFVTWIKKI